MIAEETVEPLLSFRQEDVAATVYDVNPLSCMRMIQADTMHFGIGGLDRRGAATLSQDQHEHARNKNRQGNRKPLQTQNSPSE
jgi:hypothetical protein